METFNLLIDGFIIAFQPLNLALIIFGCSIGLFIGAMPGLGSVNGVAILLPMTFLVPPTGAIIFLGAIYYGAMYRWRHQFHHVGYPRGIGRRLQLPSTAALWLLQGLADRATGRGGICLLRRWHHIGTSSLPCFAAPLAEAALAFGAPEEFALMLLAFANIHRPWR